jgi:O-antigen/teichoic acid export membrane protein
VTHGSFLRHIPLVLLLMVVVSRDVHAYLDPGTGSLVFQTVVAALAAIAYGFRSYWGRIRTLFGHPPSRTSEERSGRRG